MNSLAVTDTETTGRYLTLDSSCDNKQQAVHPLPIQIPNGEIIMSTHTALLYQQYQLTKANKSHLFPGINKALMSIWELCSHGCQATFDDKYVLILDKGNGPLFNTKLIHTVDYLAVADTGKTGHYLTLNS